MVPAGGALGAGESPALSADVTTAPAVSTAQSLPPCWVYRELGQAPILPEALAERARFLVFKIVTKRIKKWLFKPPAKPQAETSGERGSRVDESPRDPV